MRSFSILAFLILGTHGELYLSELDSVKGCDGRNDTLLRYEDISRDKNIEHTVANLLSSSGSRSAWIDGHPLYSQNLIYHGCYNLSCLHERESCVDDKNVFSLTADRTLFRCADKCSRQGNTVNAYGDLTGIAISNLSCFCIRTGPLLSIFHLYAVDNSFCDDHREKLFNNTWNPMQTSADTNMVPIFRFDGNSEIESIDNMTPTFKQCSFATSNEKHIYGSCDIGDGFICSTSPHKTSINCPVTNNGFCLFKKELIGYLGSEKTCHQYSGVLSETAPDIQNPIDPENKYLLGTFREFAISYANRTKHTSDCVHAYVDNSDKTVKFGAEKCSSNRHAVCLIQTSESPPSDENHSTPAPIPSDENHSTPAPIPSDENHSTTAPIPSDENHTTIGVSVSAGLFLLVCIVVSVIVVVARRKQHNIKQNLDNGPQQPKQLNLHNKRNTQGGGANALGEDNSEYACVIYSAADGVSPYNYVSTSEIHKNSDKSFTNLSYDDSTINHDQSDKHIYHKTVLNNDTYDQIDLKSKGKTRKPRVVGGDNVYDHAMLGEGHYNTCSDINMKKPVENESNYNVCSGVK